jgi:arginyl-tRNA synthetase
MKNAATILKELFCQATVKAFPALKNQEFPVELVQSTQEKFGHYQYNSAMKLAKQLQQNPRNIAESIIQQIDVKQYPLIAQLSVAGPGFINITLDSDAIAEFVQKMLCI